MKYKTVFNLIATEFKKAGIDYVLIGGFAVNAHHFSRFTEDIDFMITEEDAPKVAQLLKNLNFELFHEHKNFTRWKASSIYSNVLVDLVFTNRITLTKVLQEGLETTVEGCLMRVPSLEHLLAMKLHAIKQQPERREHKDWLDIIELITVNKVDVRADRFKELCLKVGTPELYKRILKYAPETEK